MKEERIFFPSTGIHLEGLIHKSEAPFARGGVILCHPHPQYGGDMDNPVIHSGLQAAGEAGYATLRFNFRGVGESGGTYAEGIGEKDDVRSAVACLDATFGGRDHFLVLLGYSFGAWVGLPVAVEDERVKAVVAVAPPLAMFDFDFLKGCKKNKLIIVGSRDLYCPIPLLEKWFQTLEEPKSLTLIEGSDHFFFSHHRSLISPIKEFFATL
jgi:alpha/beta superfamily hydrolase